MATTAVGMLLRRGNPMGYIGEFVAALTIMGAAGFAGDSMFIYMNRRGGNKASRFFLRLAAAALIGLLGGGAVAYHDRNMMAFWAGFASIGFVAHLSMGSLVSW